MAEKLNWTCFRGCPMSWTISMSVSRSLGGCPFRCVLFALQQSVGFVLYACPGGHLLLNLLHPSQPSLGLYRCRCYGWRWWCWWKRSPGTRTLFLTLKIKCFVIIVIWCMTSKAGESRWKILFNPSNCVCQATFASKLAGRSLWNVSNFNERYI